MTVTTSYETELVCGIAQRIADAGLGTFLRPDSGEAYPDETVMPIYLEGTVVDRDAGIWVLYQGSPAQGNDLNDVTSDVQIIVRLDATHSRQQCGDYASAIRDLFQPAGRPLTHATLGLVRISRVVRQTYVDLARDSKERPLWSQTYLVSGRRYLVQ